MANDRWYNPGDNYFLDDNTGFKVRASKARLQWNNIATSGSHWNPRQPQDLVVAVRDEQIAALVRPRQPNIFVITGTVVTAFAPQESTSIVVDSTVGFSPGNRVQVMLDQGAPFQFTLVTVSGNTLSWSGAGLPGTVGGMFGDPIENSVINLTAGDNVVLPQTATGGNEE